MDEGDPRAHSAWPGGLADHPHPAPPQVRHCLVKVGYLEGDMVQARPAPLDETLDNPWSRCFQQLQVGVPDGQHTLNEAVGELQVTSAKAKQLVQQAGCPVAVVRERDMMQAS